MHARPACIRPNKQASGVRSQAAFTARVAGFSTLRVDGDQADTVLGYAARVGAGYWTGGNTNPENYCRILGEDRRLLGHPGTGGSIAWADPTHDVAVSICHNRMFNAPSEAYDSIKVVVDQVVAGRA